MSFGKELFPPTLVGGGGVISPIGDLGDKVTNQRNLQFSDVRLENRTEPKLRIESIGR